MEKLNVAVIGTGSWGNNHARAFNDLPSTNLLGIFDISESRAKEIAKKYNTQAFSSLDELLSLEHLDAISIASPTSTHAAIALQAINQGKHVLIEKPMTSTVKEAEEVIDAEKANNVNVFIGFIERFNPVVSRSQTVVSTSELGKLVLISARRLGPFWPDRLKDVDVIRDVSIHDIDSFRFIAKKDPVSVYARGGCLRHVYYDYAEILLDFGDGVTGFIESNYLTPHKYRKLSLTCENGIVEADFMTQEYELENDEFVKKRKLPWQEPLGLELSAFVSSCLEKKPPQISSTDGLKALKIAMASIESIEKHKVIELDL